MEFAVDLLTVAVPILYALTALNSILLFVSRGERLRACSLPLLGATVGLHALLLGLKASTTVRCPIATILEAVGVMGLALGAVFLVLELRRGSRPTGILILPLAFVLVLIATVFGGGPVEVTEALKSPWFSIHSAAAVIAVAALAVSCVHGVFYLLLYRQIKTHRHGRLFRGLPPLTVLARMTLMAAVIGWALLLVTILAGYVWGVKSGGLADMHGDPLFLVTVAAWVLYSVGLGARYLVGWRGRFTVYLSICGFAFLIASLVAATVFWPSMHSVR
jgi:ABC-type uncharacterized transport system permease subunit